MIKRVLFGGKNIPRIECLEAPMYSGPIDKLDTGKEKDREIKEKLETMGVFSGNSSYLDAKVGNEQKFNDIISEIEKTDVKYLVYTN